VFVVNALRRVRELRAYAFAEREREREGERERVMLRWQPVNSAPRLQKVIFAKRLGKLLSASSLLF
jgi:hypothetical protein